MEDIFLKLKEVWNSIKNAFKKVWSNIKQVLFKIYSKNIEFRKLLIKYNRTKKKRVKNKYYNKMMKFIISHPIRG